MNASASRVADISLRALSLSHALFFSFLFFSLRQGVFFATAVLGATCTIPSITHKALEESTRTREISVVFLPNPPLPSPSLPSRHDDPTQANHMYLHIPSHRVSPIGSCEAHLFIIIVFSFPFSFWIP